VVIDQFDIEGVVTLKPKHDAPVRTHGYGPESLQVALKRVQSIAGQVKSLWRFGIIKDSQNFLNGLYQIRPHSTRVAIFVKPLQPPDA
jgi:hypothetical protein